MLLIAHRGFSAGKDENTLTAMARAAAESRIGGVELDIRLSADRRDVVLRHDPFTGAREEPAPASLDEALAFAAQRRWQVFLECKEYDEVLYRRVRELVDQHAMAERIVLFGFKDVAQKFAWRAARPFRLGVIEEYPWRIAQTVDAFRPDVLLMGWMSTPTRLAVQSWWSAFSLSRLARKIPETSLVMGVARDDRHVDWFRRQNALYAATIDLKRRT
jgi:glycerophosphoryl diester phosphodiesterase